MNYWSLVLFPDVVSGIGCLRDRAGENRESLRQQSSFHMNSRGTPSSPNLLFGFFVAPIVSVDLVPAYEQPDSFLIGSFCYALIVSSSSLDLCIYSEVTTNFSKRSLGCGFCAHLNLDFGYYDRHCVPKCK